MPSAGCAQLVEIAWSVASSLTRRDTPRCLELFSRGGGTAVKTSVCFSLREGCRLRIFFKAQASATPSQKYLRANAQLLENLKAVRKGDRGEIGGGCDS